MNAVLHENQLERYERVYTANKNMEISGETVVPDRLPDIGLVGDTNSHVLLRSKRTEQGRCVLEGEYLVSVCYLPDGASGLRMLKMELPWQAEFLSEDIMDQDIAVADVRIVQQETRLLNPRKILVKATLAAMVTVYRKLSTAVCDGIADDETVQVCRERVECSIISTVCEKTFAATDEYPLPAEMAGGEVLAKTVQFRVEEVKTLANKLIVKGSVLSDVVVSGEAGSPERVSFSSSFSFIAETDCENVSDDVCVTVMPTAMYYEPSANGRVLSMEVHGVCQMTVYGKGEVCYLSDAYSNFYPCTCEFDELSVFHDTRKSGHRETINGSIACRSQIARVGFLSGNHTVGSGKESAQVEAVIGAYVQYENGMSDWVKKTVMVPLKLKPAERLMAVRLVDLYGTFNGTELEYRFTVDCDIREETSHRLRLLQQVTYDEQSPFPGNRPSFMVVRGRNDLWDLARQYGSTVELIRKYNALEEEESDCKELLLIPRQRR